MKISAGLRSFFVSEYVLVFSYHLCIRAEIPDIKAGGEIRQEEIR